MFDHQLFDHQISGSQGDVRDMSEKEREYLLGILQIVEKEKEQERAGAREQERADWAAAGTRGGPAPGNSTRLDPKVTFLPCKLTLQGAR